MLCATNGGCNCINVKQRPTSTSLRNCLQRNHKLRHTRLRFLWFKRSRFHRTTGCPVRKDYCYHSTAVVLHFQSTPHKIQVKIPWPACVDDVSSVECDIDSLVVVVVVEVVSTVVVVGSPVHSCDQISISKDGRSSIYTVSQKTVPVLFFE